MKILFNSLQIEQFSTSLKIIKTTGYMNVLEIIAIKTCLIYEIHNSYNLQQILNHESSVEFMKMECMLIKKLL